MFLCSQTLMAVVVGRRGGGWKGSEVIVLTRVAHVQGEGNTPTPEGDKDFFTALHVEPLPRDKVFD